MITQVVHLSEVCLFKVTDMKEVISTFQRDAYEKKKLFFILTWKNANSTLKNNFTMICIESFKTQ